MATAAISGGHVTGINITYEGSGYRLLHPPTVTITGGNGTGATVTITVDETVGETNAAKMTVMVGEGDEFITGDYLAFKGTTLWDGTTSNGNSSSSPNNVWNGKSTLFNADGIDVDTFTITWASGLLHHGDTSANIDMYTAQDNWNLVFIILSFRSSVATGDSLAYLITRH
jgi:hypothetical protein